MHWWVLMCGPLFVMAVPRFDPTAILRNVRVPADAAVGSVIYRLRASDPSYAYPLIFDIDGEITIASVDTLNCTRFNSVCQANVVVKKKLEPGRVYDFRVTVTNNKRESASMDCSFRATNATTPVGVIFPGAPTLLMISENARRNTELGNLVVKGNPLREKAVVLELWGPPQFSLRQRIIAEKDAEGTVILLGKLDYEVKTVHHITIFANDPYTEPENDSRNIASWPLLIAVLDEQDTPPVFTLAPPTTNLDPQLKPGDSILTVKAEDGDRGKPRDIRYGLVSEGNPFTPFFNLSEETGELRLAKPLSEIQAISHSNTPIILTVVAEEVRSNPSESPAQSSTVRLALIPPTPASTKPHFSYPEYVTDLDENAAPGTILNLKNAELFSQAGLLFTLELQNNNGTFDVSPNVVEGKSKFMVKVRDNTLLDYESRKSVTCRIFAKEFGDGAQNLNASANLVVNLRDINDNPPVFTDDNLQADILEGSEVGTIVLKVQATDLDSGQEIRYKRLYGPGSELFIIDPISGVITVANSLGLDSENASVLRFTVEVTDEETGGNTATTSVTINVIDVNDEIPKFEKNPYEFILHTDRRKFTIPAYITAIDNDLTPPNNEVRYELMGAIENITLHPVTGELVVNPIWNGDKITVLKARAYDGGIPRLWTECEIRLYPPENKQRKMIFIVSGNNPNLEEYLSSIVGGHVVVDKVRPYNGAEQGAFDISKGTDKKVVETTVTYSGNSVIDIDKLHTILNHDNVQVQVQKEEIKTSGASNLWWLLLVLLLLILLFMLILILCCICEGCPLYVSPKQRRKVTPTDVERLVVRGQGNGHENKSVQVAEWFGRREAWTPEHNAIDVEVDSIRRHEMERGSDRGEVRRVQKQQATQDVMRDQLYIREGNADILRLLTRGGEQQQQQLQQQQRPVTLLPDNTFIIDSGKDILMRRFIDQQEHEATKAQIYHQTNLNRIQSEHDILEESLRQQNALLRQLLLERERDLRFETQSLPAGTQTDQNVSTQTEPLFLRPPRRQTRSDNDASDNSDDEDQYIIMRRRRNVRKHNVKRKIRTPIQEESESSHEHLEKQQKSAEVSRVRYSQTKSSMLRKMKAESARSKSSSHSKSSLKKEILQEISDSLNQTESENENEPPKKQSSVESKTSDRHQQATYYSSDSLDEISPRSESLSAKNERRRSAIDLNTSLEENKSLKLSSSHNDLSKVKQEESALTTTKPARRSTARYMEWYNKNGEAKPTKPKKSKQNGEIKKSKEKVKVKTKDEDMKPSATKVSKRLYAETQSSMRKKIELPTAPGPEHPLIQHSKNRFEIAMPKRLEEDGDSGIALTRPSMAQKKSVFTIAYDDMQTKQLPESVSTP